MSCMSCACVDVCACACRVQRCAAVVWASRLKLCALCALCAPLPLTLWPCGVCGDTARHWGWGAGHCHSATGSVSSCRVGYMWRGVIRTRTHTHTITQNQLCRARLLTGLPS